MTDDDMTVGEALGIASTLAKYPPAAEDQSIAARQTKTVLTLAAAVERLRVIEQGVAFGEGAPTWYHHLADLGRDENAPEGLREDAAEALTYVLAQRHTLAEQRAELARLRAVAEAARVMFDLAPAGVSDRPKGWLTLMQAVDALDGAS